MMTEQQLNQIVLATAQLPGIFFRAGDLAFVFRPIIKRDGIISAGFAVEDLIRFYFADAMGELLDRGYVQQIASGHVCLTPKGLAKRKDLAEMN